MYHFWCNIGALVNTICSNGCHVFNSRCSRHRQEIIHCPEKKLHLLYNFQTLYMQTTIHRHFFSCYKIIFCFFIQTENGLVLITDCISSCITLSLSPSISPLPPPSLSLTNFPTPTIILGWGKYGGDISCDF